MSRKQQPKDPSGFVFDVRSGAVRAHGCSENMKEKVQAVRAVVPNRSNTEIVLVLQHFDNAVDSAVHAFVEGNASEVLKEWTVTGKKKNKRRKAQAPPPARPRPPAKPRPPGKPRPEEAGSETANPGGNPGVSVNGFHGNGPEGPREPPTAPPPNPSRSLRSDPGGKKMGSGLEKSLKELQRCSVALARFRALLREELENSLRRVRVAFQEIQSCLMDREVALLAEMDKVKAEAMELLALRQRRAESLRALTEAAPRMSEEQLLELRADIKHFVSERKLDEELGRAGRFGCDIDALRGSIGTFGRVSHPRPSYSSRSRCGSGPTTGSGMGSAPTFPTGSAPGSSTAFPTGSGTGSAPTFPAGSATGSTPGSAPGSSPTFPTGSGMGSSLTFPVGSSQTFPTGSSPGSTPGSAPGSSPTFPTGSGMGSSLTFPTGSSPGSTPGSALGSAPGAPGSSPALTGSSPTFPTGSAPGSPPEPQPPQRSRNPPGAAAAQNPPGTPKNPPGSPKNPQIPQNPKTPETPQTPGIPKNSQIPKKTPETPPKKPQNPQKYPENSPKNPSKTSRNSSKIPQNSKKKPRKSPKTS